MHTSQVENESCSQRESSFLLGAVANAILSEAGAVCGSVSCPPPTSYFLDWLRFSRRLLLTTDTAGELSPLYRGLLLPGTKYHHASAVSDWSILSQRE